MEELYTGYVAAANARDFDRLREYAHDPMSVNGKVVSREEMIADFRRHVTAIPDLTWALEDLVIQGDRIAARLVNTGTPADTWLGLAPTGQSVSFVECAFYRIRDGRIEASWFLMDRYAVEQQLDPARE